MSEIASIIGERLRSYRKRAGLSQEGLAEKAGLHNTYIGQLERGEKNATLESIEKVATALQLPFEVLFENLIPYSENNRVVNDCYNKIVSLSNEDQQAICEIIERIITFKTQKP